MTFGVLLLASWYLQDLMQVLLTTAFLGPELFVMVLNRLSCQQEDVSPLQYLIPMFGGIAFDLRWSGIPGLCGLLYVLSHWIFREVWFDKLPRDGRRPISFFLINLVLLSFIAAVRLFFWRGSGSLGHLLWIAVFHLILSVIPLWFLSIGRYDDETPNF